LSHLKTGFFSIAFVFAFSLCLQAQKSVLVDIKKERQYNTSTLLENIAEQSDYILNYNPADFHKNIYLPKDLDTQDFQSLLNYICDLNNVDSQIIERTITLFKKEERIPLKEIKFSTINGYVEDSSSGERLIGAHLIALKQGQGTNSNEFGFFSMHLPEGQRSFHISYIGYQDSTLILNLEKDTTLVIALKPNNYLDDIIIRSDRKRISEESRMSSIELSNGQLENEPGFLGEKDIMNSLESLPGVAKASSIQSGVIVRGGASDQNLVLLDGVPLYNTSHVGGLYSIFNNDVVKNVNLSKGAFPARYGGRLSSIVDIRLKDGDLEKIHGNLSLNLIASKFALEGPISKGKTSFVISGRRSYIDLLTKEFFEENDGDRLFYNFHDVNTKLQHIINKKHRIYLNFYNGRDIYGDRSIQLGERDENILSWGNSIVGARWNWEISRKLFLHTNLSFLKFNQSYKFRKVEFNLTEISQIASTNFRTEIRDYALRFNFDYIPNLDHFIRFGFEAQRHRYLPGNAQITFVNANIQTDSLVVRNAVYATELNAYFQDDIRLGKLKLNAGIHLSGFHVDESFYTSVQPRLSARYPVELFAKRNKGKVNGWISYTLGRNERKFEGINGGKWFSDKYDIRHKFSINGSYQIKESIRFSMHWHYISGRYGTIPNVQVPVLTINSNSTFVSSVNAATNRNNYKFSDAHRLDFSFDFIKKRNSYTRTWSFGLFNAYNAQDPLYVQVNREQDPDGNPYNEYSEVSIFAVSIPSILYKIEF